MAFDLFLSLKLHVKRSALGLTKQLQVFCIDSAFCAIVPFVI